MSCDVTSLLQVAPRFEIKKWNAVAMWSWDICADTCAICRNSLNEPSIEYQVHTYVLFLPCQSTVITPNCFYFVTRLLFVVIQQLAWHVWYWEPFFLFSRTEVYHTLTRPLVSAL